MDSEAVASIIEDPDFRIITTLKHVHFNSHDVAQAPQLIQEWKQEELKLLYLHGQRLKTAAQACSWSRVCVQLQGDEAALGLFHTIEEATTTQQPQPAKSFFREIRVRILVDSGGHTGVETVPMSGEKPLEALENNPLHELPSSFDDSGCRFSTVYVDSTPTPTTIFTANKTTFRQPYDNARLRAGILQSAPMNAEVLLFNLRREITEASVCTPYFFRDGGWVTPPSVSGGMLSVTKLKALQAGFCVERLVPLDELRHGELIWLSNAVRGFFRGRICKDTTAVG
ncbi:hypothetical protein A1O3_01875 [Capronia epimyces CBS 606.96]|uniref:Aminodeoxychorismate lyase n=1 Tax=Capronia epimyces CBS 606.96 TaxID=1182542 RepID=W9YHS0_9EURO|nr:uncharacterized protein A1O3_01875 [Capronia epimyces CBS 606.96]EXJ88811.1 hypothetical protein A1O3_01875 [Capronia epimyces CBS 606.96]